MANMYAEAYVVDGDATVAVVAEACVVSEFESAYGAASASVAAFGTSGEPYVAPNSAPTMHYTQHQSPDLGGSQVPPELQPISEPLPEPSSVRLTVELYENERYSPRLGFTCRGLLINDRGMYSIDDGSVSFSTLEEASMSLISKGYSYIEDWVVHSALGIEAPVPLREVLAGKGADGGTFGWLYNVDFGTYSANPGQAKKGVAHFVRRRRMTRVAVFNENALTNNPRQSCQSCDLRCIEQLALPLAEKVFKALRQRYGAKESRVHKIMKLKSMAIDMLFGLPQNTFNANFVVQQLEEFVTAQAKTLNVVSALSDRYPDGRAFLALFPAGERAAIIRALIRKHDLAYHFHCAEVYCGMSCQFAVHRCPNNGCSVTFSRKWWGEHDANCPYKVVACPLQCGMYVARNATPAHVANDCIMRLVPCPFARVGCQPPGLIFRDVEAHCSVNHEYHLSLSTAHLDALLREKATLAASMQALEPQVRAAEATVARQRGQRVVS